MKGFRRMGPLQEEKRERLTHGGQEAHSTHRKGLVLGYCPAVRGRSPQAAKGVASRLAPGQARLCSRGQKCHRGPCQHPQPPPRSSPRQGAGLSPDQTQTHLLLGKLLGSLHAGVMGLCLQVDIQHHAQALQLVGEELVAWFGPPQLLVVHIDLALHGLTETEGSVTAQAWVSALRSQDSRLHPAGLMGLP